MPWWYEEDKKPKVIFELNSTLFFQHSNLIVNVIFYGCYSDSSIANGKRYNCINLFMLSDFERKFRITFFSLRLGWLIKPPCKFVKINTEYMKCVFKLMKPSTASSNWLIISQGHVYIASLHCVIMCNIMRNISPPACVYYMSSLLRDVCHYCHTSLR